MVTRTPYFGVSVVVQQESSLWWLSASSGWLVAWSLPHELLLVAGAVAVHRGLQASHKKQLQKRKRHTSSHQIPRTVGLSVQEAQDLIQHENKV